jgi:hypothetical protein
MRPPGGTISKFPASGRNLLSLVARQPELRARADNPASTCPLAWNTARALEP